MQSNSSTVRTTASAGDGAVEGLLYGLVAGVIMLAYLVFISLALQFGPLNLLDTVAGGLDVCALAGDCRSFCSRSLVWPRLGHAMLSSACPGGRAILVVGAALWRAALGCQCTAFAGRSGRAGDLWRRRASALWLEPGPADRRQGRVRARLIRMNGGPQACYTWGPSDQLSTVCPPSRYTMHCKPVRSQGLVAECLRILFFIPIH